MISIEQRRQFLWEGYLQVPDVVPADACNAAVEAMEVFLGVDRRDPASWRRQRADGHGIVPIHHADALWSMRQLPAVYELFCDLHQRRDLWVSVDRASFKVPRSGRVDAPHWDVNPHTFDGFGVQGLVYLTDTSAHMGPFVCYPALYRHIDDWRRGHPGEVRPDVSAVVPLPLPGPAGSMVLWHRLMPHTSLPNTGAAPRCVQYISMHPAGDEAARQELAREFMERMPPAWALRQQIAHQEVPEPGVTPVLTELGEKLAGLRPWPGH